MEEVPPIAKVPSSPSTKSIKKMPSPPVSPSPSPNNTTPNPSSSNFNQIDQQRQEESQMPSAAEGGIDFPAPSTIPPTPPTAKRARMSTRMPPTIGGGISSSVSSSSSSIQSNINRNPIFSGGAGFDAISSSNNEENKNPREQRATASTTTTNGGGGRRDLSIALSEDDSARIRSYLKNRSDAAKIIYGPNAKALPCSCRVRNEGKPTEDCPETCEAKEFVNDKITKCQERITTATPTLARAHIRNKLQVMCSNHAYRLRLHQCCPQCGIFCMQGRFFECHESSPPHYFHLACTNEFGQCPHCCGKNFKVADVNLTVFAADMETAPPMQQARMQRVPSDIPSDVMRLVNAPIEAFMRLNTHRLPGTEKDICTADLRNMEDREMIRKAIQEVDMSIESSDENFEEAMRIGDLRIILSILAKRTDVDHVLSDGSTLLQRAASLGWMHVCYVLCVLKADVNLKDAEGRTAVTHAAMNDHREVADILIRIGKCDVSMKDNGGDTALHIAAKQGAAGVASLLINWYVEWINEQDNGGWTPLMWAAEHGQEEVVRLLAERMADQSIMDSEGNLAIHWAAMSGSLAIGHHLIDSEYLINRGNHLGQTPLMIACRENNFAFVELLLSHGGDPRLVDTDGKRAEDYLRLNIHDENDLQVWILKLAERGAEAREVAKSRPKRGLIMKDFSNGKERFPIKVINDVDNESPTGVEYVTSVVETPGNAYVNRKIIPGFMSCKCIGGCTLGKDAPCVCQAETRTIWYGMHGRLSDDFPFENNRSMYLYECNALCACPPSCRNRVVQHGMKVALSLIRTKDKGWGVFAAQDIPRGTFICEYAGELITAMESDQRLEDTYLFEITDPALLGARAKEAALCIDANLFGNISRYFNHSCSPNLFSIKVFFDHCDANAPHLAFFAYNDIKKDEELTFDYGPKFWNVKGFGCKCRQNYCRFAVKEPRTDGKTMPSGCAKKSA